MLYDLAVIGGGAAGLAAAVSASRCGDRVIILESGNAIGKKVLSSGNGRCNLMNTGELRYFGNSSFAGEVLKHCGTGAQKKFWNSIGLIIVEETENRVYPCTFHAATVLEVLRSALKKHQVDVMLNTRATAVERFPTGIFHIPAGEREIQARRILVATGGPAGLKSRTDFSGYGILRKFGHTVFPLKPSLVPLVTDPKSISGLYGVRVRCSLTLFDSSHTAIHSEKGELLFTHYGISGICTMQFARFIDAEGYYVEADFTGALFPDDNALMDELIMRKSIFSSMPPESLLAGMLHPKLAYAVMKQAGAPMKGERLSEMDDGFLLNVSRVLRHYRIEIHGIRGMEDAQVTAGGADCREFRPDSMESRIVPGLHAAGEVLDVDGACGGYNLMFAFGSGILAGLNTRSGSKAREEGLL